MNISSEDVRHHVAGPLQVKPEHSSNYYDSLEECLLKECCPFSVDYPTGSTSAEKREGIQCMRTWHSTLLKSKLRIVPVFSTGNMTSAHFNKRDATFYPQHVYPTLIVYEIGFFYKPRSSSTPLQLVATNVVAPITALLL